LKQIESDFQTTVQMNQQNILSEGYVFFLWKRIVLMDVTVEQREDGFQVTGIIERK